MLAAGCERLLSSRSAGGKAAAAMAGVEFSFAGRKRPGVWIIRKGDTSTPTGKLLYDNVLAGVAGVYDFSLRRLLSQEAILLHSFYSQTRRRIQAQIAEGVKVCPIYSPSSYSCEVQCWCCTLLLDIEEKNPSH